MNPSKRKKVRELTFILVYQDYFYDKSSPLKDALELIKSSSFNEECEKEALKLREMIKEKEEELEKIIELYSKWRKERIDLIDIAILKVALCELLYEPDIPPAVTINEAVELAKKYSSAKAYKFINGLLDRVMRERMRKFEAL